MQESISLKYEPASVPQHISVKWLFLKCHDLYTCVGSMFGKKHQTNLQLANEVQGLRLGLGYHLRV